VNGRKRGKLRLVGEGTEQKVPARREVDGRNCSGGVWAGQLTVKVTAKEEGT